MKGVFLQTTTETVASIAGNIGEFFTEAISWLGEAIDVIVSEPLLMTMVVAVPLSGWAFGAIKRLIRL